MSDPITTIITTAVEHAPSAVAVAATLKAAKDFFAKVAGPAVEELGEIGRDYVKGWRAKNGNAVLAGADTLLAEVGREPQAVPLKVLLPLLDAASLEDEPTLANLWAALLANAANPAQRVQVLPGFVSILKELTAYDALLLETIAKWARQTAPDAPVNVFTPAATVKDKVGVEVTENEFYISLDNLGRLNLTLSLGSKPLPNGGLPSGFHPMLNDVGPGKEKTSITHLGLAFLTAVTPPTP